MTRQFLVVLTLVLGCNFQLFAQSDDPVLFTVNNDPVHVSEFEYIYTKTNGEKADFSRKSLREYLNLYVKFKLKVEKAKEMQLDTIQSLQRELEGYRRQLADSYLIDKEVTENLIREAYERTKQDVDISHIVIKAEAGADSIMAYKTAMKVLSDLKGGASFEKLAEQYSSDKSVTKNKGRIGYVTALFPNGFEKLEAAAYNQPLDEYSQPIRTVAGYHILKVHDRRPARGEVEVAHILIRHPKSQPDKTAITKDPKGLIDSLYIQLQNGANFEELAKAYSQDKRTAEKGGYVGFFGINRYEKPFENGAFGLEKDGDYTTPFETSAGWHILKRISFKGVEPYNIAKSRLENQIKKDSRFEAAKRAMIEKIKEENNFMEFNTTLNRFTKSLDKDFLSYKWKAPKDDKKEELLFTFSNDYKVTLGDFTSFLERASRKRIRMGRSTNIEDAVAELYGDFKDESCLKYEEQQLDEKYPEFKALMREYEEGILLFEATKMLVWDKAAQDSSGLEEFFKTIEGRYKWRERADVIFYTINTEDEKKLAKITKYISKKSPEKVMAKFNKDPQNPVVTKSLKTFEQGRNRVLEAMDWKVGATSDPEFNDKQKAYILMKIETITPGSPKTLDEARGYVIADYQDYLERKWVEELREEYPVEIKEPVFDAMVKK
jgi:peptidyl-prolyl cis-trans isomerase SurA